MRARYQPWFGPRVYHRWAQSGWVCLAEYLQRTKAVEEAQAELLRMAERGLPMTSVPISADEVRRGITFEDVMRSKSNQWRKR